MTGTPGASRRPARENPKGGKGSQRTKKPGMKLDELDENDVTGRVADFDYAKWKKRQEEEAERHEEEERRRMEKAKLDKERQAEEKRKGNTEKEGRENIRQGSKPSPERSVRASSGSATGKRVEEYTAKRRGSRKVECAKHKTSSHNHPKQSDRGTPGSEVPKAEESPVSRKASPVPQPNASSGKAEKKDEKGQETVVPKSKADIAKESTPEKSSSRQSLWGSHEVLPENSDIEGKTYLQFLPDEQRKFTDLGFAFFISKVGSAPEIRMLAFGPGETSYSGSSADFTNEKMVLYTSKPGNGLFLVNKKAKGLKFPIMPSIEPKVTCKTSVVFNKDNYYVEEARHDSAKLNAGEHAMNCIIERQKVDL